MDCSVKSSLQQYMHYIDGLVQKRCNSSALAMELCLSCTNPSILFLATDNVFCISGPNLVIVAWMGDEL